MTCSWPTTTLRTWARMPSVIDRRCLRSIQNLPLPAMGIPRNIDERSGVFRLGRGKDLRSPDQPGKIDRDPARGTDAGQPVGQSPPIEAGRRPQLPCNAADGRKYVVCDNDLGVAGVAQQ